MDRSEPHSTPDLIKDYEQTTQVIRLLTDTRFKLLAIVPVVTGFAVTLMTGAGADRGAQLAVGLLGALVTLGILLYDLRNSQLYDAAIHRAKRLEELLDFPVASNGRVSGGLYSERPSASEHLLLIFRIKHDRGLALVYSASLAAWCYLILDALAVVATVVVDRPRMLLPLLFTPAGQPVTSESPAFPTVPVIVFGVAALIGLLIYWHLRRLDDRRATPKPPVLLQVGEAIYTPSTELIQCTGRNLARSAKLPANQEAKILIGSSRVKSVSASVRSCKLTFLERLGGNQQPAATPIPLSALADDGSHFGYEKSCTLTVPQVVDRPILQLSVHFHGDAKAQPYQWLISSPTLTYWTEPEGWVPVSHFALMEQMDPGIQLIPLRR
jgi:hypothetical protein